MITTTRGRNNNYLLMDGDRQVGEVWKMRGEPGFGMKLYGIYWRKGKPNTVGGNTAIGVRRLMDAAPLAERTFALNA